MNDINSLSHSKWRCKYHIVFAPKYRRQSIYGDIRKDIGVLLRKLCEQKKVEIIEAELCPDHIQYVGKHTAKPECVAICGISEMEEQSNDIRQACEFEV